MKRICHFAAVFVLVVTACAPAVAATESPILGIPAMDIPTTTPVPPTGTKIPKSTSTLTPSTPEPSDGDLIYGPLHMALIEASGVPIYQNQECVGTTTTWVSEILLTIKILNPDTTLYRNDVLVAVLPVEDKNKDGKIDTIEIRFARPLAKGALQAVAEIPDLNDPATYTHSMILSINLSGIGSSMMFTLWRIDAKGDYIQYGRIGDFCILNKNVIAPNGGNDNGGGGLPTDPPPDGGPVG